ncbi:hypothetical protein [uncultured Methylobacterium sp.]|uniref:hypothetical protein n=1 Tax=uncultured Methylobacterium sp. TaxID=157278 RepID=UPI00262F4DF8|nr:hypothetical protein [uncultured Methylobacterium sp.]
MRDQKCRRTGAVLLAAVLIAAAAPAVAQPTWVDPPAKQPVEAEPARMAQPPRRSPAAAVRTTRPVRVKAAAAAPAARPVRRAAAPVQAARRVRVVTARPMASRSFVTGRRGWAEVPPGGEVILLDRPPLSGHLVTRRVVWQDETGIRSRTYRVLVDDALW